MARELRILPRFKRDYQIARGHPEFDIETLEYVFDVMISGGKLPDAVREHRLDKRSVNWAGFAECHTPWVLINALSKWLKFGRLGRDS